MSALGMMNHKNGHMRTAAMYTAATTHFVFGSLTAIGLLARIAQQPSRLHRLHSNFTSIVLRTGIIAMDIASSILLLGDPEGESVYSLLALNMMAASVVAGRLLSEDGHDDEESDEENEKLLKEDEKTSYGASV